jgi:hypothetical protein
VVLLLLPPVLILPVALQATDRSDEDRTTYSLGVGSLKFPIFKALLKPMLIISYLFCTQFYISFFVTSLKQKA